MAENNKNKNVKYKFGQDDLSLKDLIYNADYNVQDYLDLQNWSDLLKLEFTNSYQILMLGLNDQLNTNNNRFSTDAFGKIIDSLGLYGDNQNNISYYFNDKGNRITADEYNTLKEKDRKGYLLFSSNGAVASYLNIIGKHLRKKPKNSSSEQSDNSNKFDFNKNDFVTFWHNKYNPGGDTTFDLTPFINKDLFNVETGKREVVNRAINLADDLLEYIDKGDYKDKDFSDTPYKTVENYVNALTNARDRLRDGTWDDNDTIAISQASIKGDLIRNLLTTEENPNITPALKKALEELKKKEEVELKKKEFIDSQYSIYQNSNPQYNNNSKFRVMGILNWRNNEGIFDYDKYANSFGKEYVLDDGKLDKLAIDNLVNQYLVNPFASKEDHAKILESLVYSGYAKPISNNPQLSGMYYIPSSSDERLNRALVYDPVNGDLFYTFVGDIPELWHKITYNYNVNNGLLNPVDRYAFKEGGVLEYQMGGGFSMGLFMQDKNLQLLEERAKANGRTVEKLKDLERKPMGEKTAVEPNNEFTSAETARILAAGADITSMISSFIPGAGTAVSAVTGLGSTAASFWADVVLDGLDWGDIKNLGTNLGMDALGLIPGGGAATKAAKITKNLKVFVPRLLAAVGTASTLANSGAITLSLGKLASDEKLTVEDWQNIAQAIGTVTGMTGGIARHYNRNKNSIKGHSLAKPKEVLDKIALLFKRQDGSIETRVFAGDDAKAIKEARDKNDIEAIKNATINKYDDLKDLELNVSTKYSIGSPVKKWGLQDPIKRTQQVRLGRIYDDTVSGTNYADFGRFKADIDGSTIKNPGKTILEVDDEIINNALNPLKVASDRDANLINKVVPNYKQRLDRFNKNFRSSSDVQADINSHNTKLTEKKLRTALIKNDKLVLLTKKLELIQILNEIKNIDSLLSTANFGQRMLLLKLKKDFIDSQTRLTAEINSINNRIKNNLGLNKGINRKRLVELLNELKTSNRVDKIKSQLLLDINRYSASDYKTRERIAFELTHSPNSEGLVTITDPTTGRKVDVKLEEIYKKLGIKYKSGGNLNISNVRKYLEGKPITNTTSTADWFTNMFSSNEMLKWIDSFTLNNYENFNLLLKSWNTNKVNTNYVPGSSSIAWNQGVQDRQKLWNDTGTNSVIEDLATKGIISRTGNSGDNADKGYVDGYFGEQEFLRHGGTEDSWKGHEEELAKFQDMLKEKGLLYTLDPNTGMYLMSPIPDNILVSENPVEEKETTVPMSTNYTFSTPWYLKKLKNDNEKNDSPLSSWRDIFTKVLSNPTITYGLPRLLYSNAMNNKMVEMSKTDPLLLDPILFHRYVKSDLAAEMLGIKNYAKLRSIANENLTSDADKLKAYALESVSRGLDEISKGRMLSDLARLLSTELAYQLEKENGLTRLKYDDQNASSIYLTILNNKASELSGMSKNTENIKLFSLQLESEAKINNLNNKALLNRFAQNDIHLAVSYNPNKYGANLSDDELLVYNKVLSGEISPSELEGNLLSLYLNAYKKVSTAELLQLRNYYGIPDTLWSLMANSFPTVSHKKSFIPTITLTDGLVKGKDGTKIKIAKLKAKTKDADRFLKLVKESLDRNEKAIERLYKNINKLINKRK